MGPAIALVRLALPFSNRRGTCRRRQHAMRSHQHRFFDDGNESVIPCLIVIILPIFSTLILIISTDILRLYCDNQYRMAIMCALIAVISPLAAHARVPQSPSVPARLLYFGARLTRRTPRPVPIFRSAQFDCESSGRCPNPIGCLFVCFAWHAACALGPRCMRSRGPAGGRRAARSARRGRAAHGSCASCRTLTLARACVCACACEREGVRARARV